GKGEDAAALQLLERARQGGAQVPMLETVLAQLRAAVPPPEPAAAPAPAAGERPGSGSEGASAAASGPAAQAPESPAETGGATALGGAAQAHGDLPCELPLEALSTFRVPVYLNQSLVPLIFDTGASITTVSRS